MNITAETVPTTWTTQDEEFFGVAADLFAAPFLRGASALLASYDTETAGTVPQVEVPARTTRHYLADRPLAA